MLRYGAVWPLMVQFDLVLSILFIWPGMTPNGSVWPSMTLYGPLWSCLVLYGPVWLCMVLYGPV